MRKILKKLKRSIFGAETNCVQHPILCVYTQYNVKREMDRKDVRPCLSLSRVHFYGFNYQN